MRVEFNVGGVGECEFDLSDWPAGILNLATKAEVREAIRNDRLESFLDIGDLFEYWFDNIEIYFTQEELDLAREKLNEDQT